MTETELTEAQERAVSILSRPNVKGVTYYGTPSLETEEGSFACLPMDIAGECGYDPLDPPWVAKAIPRQTADALVRKGVLRRRSESLPMSGRKTVYVLKG